LPGGQQVKRWVTGASGALLTIIRSRFGKWLIAWLILTALAAIWAYPIQGANVMLRSPFGCALLLAAIAATHYIRRPCIRCGRRWAGARMDHPRKDGRPDLRYKKNSWRCGHCGQIKGTAAQLPATECLGCLGLIVGCLGLILALVVIGARGSVGP
jgi:hypothetical protein